MSGPVSPLPRPSLLVDRQLFNFCTILGDMVTLIHIAW